MCHVTRRNFTGYDVGLSINPPCLQCLNVVFQWMFIFLDYYKDL